MRASIVLLAISVALAVAIPLGEKVPESGLPKEAKARLAVVEKQLTYNGNLDSKRLFFLKCDLAKIKKIGTGEIPEIELTIDQANKIVCKRDSKGETINAKVWTGRLVDSKGNDQCTITVNAGHLTGLIVHGVAASGKVTRYSLKTLAVEKGSVWVRVGQSQARRPPGINDHPKPRFAEADVRADTTINLQIGYTAAAAQESGGADKLKSKIANAIATANVAFRNSNTKVALKAVGTIKTKTNDNSSPVPEVSPVLNALITGKTTQWKDIWDAAKANKADIIVMITARTLRCGAARPGVTASDAGVAVDVGTAVMYVNNAHLNWDNCFGHEIAHLFGCDHDIKTLGGTATSQQKAAKNLGYVYSSTTWRTVMAYPNAGSFDTPAKAPHYSDPKINYLGKPTGVGITQCASVIRKNSAAIAKLRTKR